MRKFFLVFISATILAGVLSLAMGAQAHPHGLFTTLSHAV